MFGGPRKKRETRKRGGEREKRKTGKGEKGREKEDRALYCELFERACAPGPMVLASVAAEVVPSERTTVSTRETETGEREGESKRERERGTERERIRGGRQDQEEEGGLARG